ncbi:hypothetical protein [Aureispira anguillae]|uniref:Uncharacterized protein n=1 Tax=Aureispira anguillae TaxID=2864201 RepID=A0A916DSM0_9BACT|nr:hypothetical protein [Aureispira anguillae]BDS11245.1 hypothetical protein AsAng_0019570 [Aureispira anguillae]
MKHQIYWLTNSELEEIDLYDTSYKEVIAPQYSVFNKFKTLFRANQDISFDTKVEPVVLKPINQNTYEVVNEGHLPFLIYIFKYYLFEKKIAAKITALSQNKIKFEAVKIVKNGLPYGHKEYFRLKGKMDYLAADYCAETSTSKDAIFLAFGSCLYFSESLKNKLEPFVQKNYKGYRFVPGIPALVC